MRWYESAGVLAVLSVTVRAFPAAYPEALSSANETSLIEARNDCGVPPPEAAAGPNALCGGSFTAGVPNDDWSFPALAAAPMFMFARENPSQWSCFPESATLEDGSPNPGTEPSGSPNPGDNCNPPPPYVGDHGPGSQFPVYIDAKYCENYDDWRVIYNLYYPHDGILNGAEGHANDWEQAIVLWKRTAPGQDWWDRGAVLLSGHGDRQYTEWKDLITIDWPEDTTEMTYGLMRRHPKVFVGEYKHAMYRDVSTWCHGIGCEVNEYRSTDWAVMPQPADMKSGSLDVPVGDGFYGHATTNPSVALAAVCGY